MVLLQDITTRLKARLPELEWMLRTREVPLKPHTLPGGLFRESFDMTPKSCVEEIKSDLNTLDKQTDLRGAQYLAKRIEKKINVLITLFQVHAHKASPISPPTFGFDSLSTRQEWMQSLEEQIEQLEEQKKAFEGSLARLKTTKDTQAVLNMQSEMGIIEKHLTLAKEKRDRG